MNTRLEPPALRAYPSVVRYRTRTRLGRRRSTRRSQIAPLPQGRPFRTAARRSPENELEFITATCPGYNLARAYKRVVREFELEFRDSNLTLAQFALLVNIGRDEPATGTEVAARLGSDLSTISRTIELLVQRELVVQARGKDRRVRVYRLSETGRAALAEVIPKWKRAKKRTLGRLDRATWRTTLGQLRSLGA